MTIIEWVNTHWPILVFILGLIYNASIAHVRLAQMQLIGKRVNWIGNNLARVMSELEMEPRTDWPT